MEVHFHIGMIKANGVESSSALNVGTNILIGFGSNSKSAQGSGQASGDSGSFSALLNAIDDRDLVDTPTWGLGSSGYPAPLPLPGWLQS